MMFRIILLATFLLFPTLSSFADIFKCGETWQNKPCEGEKPVTTLDETGSTEQVANKDLARDLRDAKQFIWKLQGRYSPVVYSSLVLAIEHCEKNGITELECKQELTSSALSTRKEIDLVDEERRNTRHQELARREALQIEAEKLTIEEAKLHELRRQNNILSNQ